MGKSKYSFIHLAGCLERHIKNSYNVIDHIDSLGPRKYHQEFFLPESGKFGWIRSTNLVDCMFFSPGQS